ncbi:MAG: hypothetical protein O6952_07915, partial [Planctomycetota bacterium]|nr:hypothetical protein [Planctomycetota bacterium]
DGLGDLDGVIRAKSEMAHHLGRRGGILVINGDDEGCRRLRAQVEQSSLLDPVGGIVTFGLGKDCDIRAVECKEGRKGISFYVRGIGWFRVERGGMPGVWCALAAIAVSSLLGSEAADMREGILRYTPPPMRMEPETVAGVTLVNDAYNANPQSAMAALDSIGRIPCRGRRSMVLGDMRELGKRSRSLHIEFGREVFSSRVECLWTLGKEARWAAEGARRAGMNQKHVFSFESPDCLAEALGVFLRPGDAVLFKASRAMKLEGVAKEVAEILRGDNEIHRVSRPEGSRQAG